MEGAVLVFVGSLIFSIGFHYFRKSLYFKRHGERCLGKVIAIERYRERRRSNDGGTTSQTYYRPDIEYEFKGFKRTLAGVSCSHIRHSLGQNVRVLVLNKQYENHDAWLMDSLHTGVIITLLAFGSALVSFAVFSGYVSVFGALVGLLISLSLSYVICRNLKPVAYSQDNKSSEDGYLLIDTPDQFKEYVSNGKLFTIVIAWFTLAFGALCLFWGYQALSYHAKTIIFADTGYLIRQLIDEPEPEKKA